MKLLRVLSEGPLQYDPEFSSAVDKIKDAGGTYIDSGDYGSVFLLNGRAVKVTTDEIELDHAEILKGKKTNYFVRIHDVLRSAQKLGVIIMDVMAPSRTEPTEEFLDNLERESQKLGIDPEELDIRQDNFMIDPKNGKMKMTDV